jgi:hypothetical protein
MKTIKITLPPKKQRIRFAPKTQIFPNNKKEGQKKACRKAQKELD